MIENAFCRGKKNIPTDSAVQIIGGIIKGSVAIKYALVARSEKAYHIGVIMPSNKEKHAVQAHATSTSHHSETVGFLTM